MKLRILVEVELGEMANGLTRLTVFQLEEASTGNLRVGQDYDEVRTIRWEDYANTEMTVGALIMDAVRELSDDDD